MRIIAANLAGSRFIAYDSLYEFAIAVKNEPPNCAVVLALSDGQHKPHQLVNWMPVKEWVMSHWLFALPLQLALLPDPENPTPPGTETETARPPTDQVSERYMTSAFQGQHPHQAPCERPGPKLMVATHQPDEPFHDVLNETPVDEH
jgi:hypothetical protein